jgi:signal transduction histidine kinase
VAGITVLLFAIPLGVAVRHAYTGQAVTALQRDATLVTTAVPDTIIADGGTFRLPPELPAGLVVGIYTPDGRKVQGAGPDTSPIAAAAHDGRLHDAVETGRLAVSAPVSSDQTVAAVVRVDVPNSTVTWRIRQAWLTMAALALVVLALAAALAGRLAKRVAAPLERLTETARALGAGDFGIQAERSGIREADAVADALDLTAQRLGALLDRERAFSTQVSHQLRTPLTALLLGLESALSRPGADLETAVHTAVRRAGQLENTIEDLLTLARDSRTNTEELSVPHLLADLEDRWHSTFTEQGRTLAFSAEDDLPTVRASAPAVRQILDVLTANALAHGTGRTTVAASDVGTGLALSVSDDGPGLIGDPEDLFAPHPGRDGTHGIGLALARSLAEAEGGRLLVRRAAPSPEFSLLLPVPAHTDTRDRAGC